MAEGNHTALPEEFILMGLTNHPETKTVLFVVFVLIYMAAIFGNLVIVSLVKVDLSSYTHVLLPLQLLHPGGLLHIHCGAPDVVSPTV